MMELPITEKHIFTLVIVDRFSSTHHEAFNPLIEVNSFSTLKISRDKQMLLLLNHCATNPLLKRGRGTVGRAFVEKAAVLPKLSLLKNRAHAS